MSDDDDFFVEDLVEFKNRKKKINSKDKGIRGEGNLCKILNNKFGHIGPFSRVVGSGNRWSQARLTKKAKEILTADIVTPDNFKFSIESKYGYSDIDLCSCFISGNKQLDEFLWKTDRDARSVNKKPLLCWRKPRKQWLVFLKELPETDYHMKYREWYVVSLDCILNLGESFFFN